MKIDLNQAGAWTPQSAAALIGSASDVTDHVQLRVTNDGIAYISHGVVGAEDVDDLLFRLETWECGNGYVGASAAQDQGWVDRVYNVVKQNWPIPSSSYIDLF